MDLFVINRYQDSDDKTNVEEQETRNLEKLKKAIEERKKLNSQIKKINSPQQDRFIEAVDNELLLRSPVIKDEDKNLKETILPTDLNVSPKRQKTEKPEFKVLGGNDFEKKSKVHRILPYWLSHPYSISTNLQKLSSTVEDQTWLESNIKSALLGEGITHLFPVQEKVIPFILQQHTSRNPFWPHDICVSAPTGSGKTLAFVLPIIQILMNDIGHHIKALVVLPVQELAIQVAKVFKKYTMRTKLKVALLSGSAPLYQEQQQIVRHSESLGWMSEVDIVVCTAGRLVEHIQNTDGFSLKHLKFLVIDEADRIMDHIQNDWLYHMDRHIKLENELMTGKMPILSCHNLNEQKAPPHKLLFSATLSQDPEKLEQWGLFQPKLFSAVAVNDIENEDTIRKYTTPEELTEQYVLCNSEDKPIVLSYFLIEQKWDRVLCFTNSSQTAHRLAVLLNIWGNSQLKVAELSASLDRSTRETVLKKFTQSDINVLIGTDALARGIDIPDCNYVISYDPPRNIKTYIHRVGRTGRAGRLGNAVTILLQNQMASFTELMKCGGKENVSQIEIPTETIKNMSETYQQAITQTKNQINEEKYSKVQKSIKVKRGFKPQKRKL
ncbi:probable ATP-dependent RNA helicase Dbp73D [Amyelois transitella]|uniref:probable ATP-dependent RNA helicase Dbp73D n=1 Tax=Amyelois transitella TaxID=680683 RepID=UPI00298FC501|nr:probable ATP-dependent RNA helicase Dbp73D [Amyelois transitella]